MTLSMAQAMTVGWIALPPLAGFSLYLVPQLRREIALLVTLVSLGYGLQHWMTASPLVITLTDSFGVTLQVDSLSAQFILTNALVSGAVMLYCWGQDRSGFFYTQLTILHGSINAALICADFISLYVALEVISIAAFLLITYPRRDRTLWIGLRYLFVSNVAMLFYLIGAALVYKANHSFAYEGLSQAPREAAALLFLGMLTKGGLFVSGLWLPVTHAEAETPVSAMLSGAVVKAGIFPLVRCSLLVEEIGPLVQAVSVGSVLLGVVYAVFETDIKRLLALSTLSQMGFIAVAPASAGIYALSHGLAKATLFLTAGNLPSRDLPTLRQRGVEPALWAALAIAALSVAGLPGLVGFSAKALTLKQLSGSLAWVFNLAAVGTAVVCAKLVFLPLKPSAGFRLKVAKPGLWLAVGLLGACLLLLHWPKSYDLPAVAKALLTLAGGGVLYAVYFRTASLDLPRQWEKLEHLLGMMILVLTGLFWRLLT